MFIFSITYKKLRKIARMNEVIVLL